MEQQVAVGGHQARDLQGRGVVGDRGAGKAGVARLAEANH